MCSIREIVDIDIRSPDCDRLKAVYEACKLLADVYAYMHTWKDNAENSEFLQHITEMSYFLIIFLIRTVLDLQHQATCFPDGMSQPEKLVLSTLACWSEFLAKVIILYLSNVSSRNMEAVRLAGLLRSPFFVYGLNLSLYASYTYLMGLIQASRSRFSGHVPPLL